MKSSEQDQTMMMMTMSDYDDTEQGGTYSNFKLAHTHAHEARRGVRKKARLV